MQSQSGKSSKYLWSVYLLKVATSCVFLLLHPRVCTQTNILGSELESPFYTMETYKKELPNVIIRGQLSISRSVISGEGVDLDINFEGTGLKDIMAVSGLDGLRTKTNHTLESASVLGIEAARLNIVEEIGAVMAAHGMTIDRRHLMLMADLMTFKVFVFTINSQGQVLGITRFGIAKMKDSVLMLASFEKTTDHLFEASFYSKKDPIDGVSECIILGIPMQIGTGLFRVLAPEKKNDKLPLPQKLVEF